MYHTINEFLQDWKFESEATLKVFKNLTNESLWLKLNDRVRATGRLAWHITLMVNEMMAKTKLSLDEIAEDAPVPLEAGEISRKYENISLKLSDAIKSQWTDESLEEKVFMFGETWTKGQVLSSLIKHQIHHRGQLTILMREAGLKVPGTYGPSYEEWAKMGMQPME